MKKRALSILLCLVLCCGLLPATAMATESIQKLTITIPEPEAGKNGAGAYKVKIAENNCEVTKATWEDADTNAPVSGAFAAGGHYRVTIELTAGSAYDFLSPQPMDITVNGRTDVTYNVLEQYRMTVTCTFPPLTGGAAALSSAGITINAPKADELPQFTAAMDGAGYGLYDENSGGFVGGVCWTDETKDAGLTDAQRVLKNGGAFLPGHTYRVTVELVAANGYEFSNPFTATVNGQTADKAYLYADMATVSYLFPALPAETTPISSVSVTAPAPAAGEKPSYSVSVSGGHYAVDTGWNAADSSSGVGWALMYSESWNDVDRALKSGETFETGKIYMIAVALKPDSGYAFASGLTSDLSKVLVNGSPASHAMLDGQRLIVYCVYPPVSSSAKTLESIAVTKAPAKTEYTAGQSFDPAGMVVTATYTDKSTGPVTGYTVTPQTLAESDKSVTVSYTEGSVTKTATTPVTVKPKDGQKTNPFKDVKESDFYYDAVLWAYYATPQVTNGISADEFAPMSTVTRGQAVTFLWRAVGCPEPKTTDNPFVDVAPSQYYYKAVLWAVENGVTNGTDATHFTPGQTCSTAHIITFLYRTLGVGDNGWYAEAAAWAGKAGLLDGFLITVSPGTDCPRAGVVLFLYRAVGK